MNAAKQNLIVSTDPIIKKAMAYLNQNPILHIDMIEALRHSRADILFASEQGVLLRHTARGRLLLSAGHDEAADMILKRAGTFDIIVARYPGCERVLEQSYGLTEKVPCIQHAFMQPTAPEISEHELKKQHIRFQTLDRTWLPFVRDNYSLGLDDDYLGERLDNQQIFGIFVSGQIAGFAGFHTEGSLGMLEILPDWRRRGYACLLQSHLTRLRLCLGFVPFTQVKAGNQASLALQKKCGYTPADMPVTWMFKPRDT